MIIWGYNIPATCPDNLFGHWIIDLMKRGTKIICIDPRLSWFASRAKHWLRLRPGTDSALAMGFLNVIINEDLYDHTFLEKWTNGAHLVREDTGKLLRESDLVRDGAQRKFCGLGSIPEKDRSSGIRHEVAYQDSEVSPAISGDFEIAADERNVTCHTVWDAFREEVDQYPLDKVEEDHRGPGRRDFQERPGFMPGASPPPFTGAFPST